MNFSNCETKQHSHTHSTVMNLSDIPIWFETQVFSITRHMCRIDDSHTALSQFGAVLQLIFIILLPSLHYFEKWALQLRYLHYHHSIHSRFSPLSLSYHSPLPSVYLLWTLLIVILMFLRLSGTICFGALQARGRQWTGHHNHSNHCIIQVWLERDTEAFMVVDTHNRQL